MQNLSKSIHDRPVSLAESVEQEKGRTFCSLCGLPAGRSNCTLAVNGCIHTFCCTGCLSVFQILFNNPGGPPADFRETDLYQTCLALGLIAKSDEEGLSGDDGNAAEGKTSKEPGPDPPRLSREVGAPPTARAGSIPEPDVDRLTQELTYEVQGMWCTACSWVVEHSLRKLHGVLKAEVSFLSDFAQVKYLPHLIGPQAIRERIEKLGYGVFPFSPEDGRRSEREGLFLRLGIVSILTANIMMISFALYFGFFQDLGPEASGYLSYTLLCLATPVVSYGGFPILRRALVGVLHGIISMDTLITVGSLSAYVYSAIQTLKGNSHVYFDTASMLVTVVLLGKFMETRAKEEISRSLSDLFRLHGGKVRLVTNGRERWVSSKALEVGTEFVLREGERSPLDGVVASGRGSVDESVLTGEPRPVGKSIGSQIAGGSLLVQGELMVRSSRPAEESSIGRMIHLIRQALLSKSPREILADRMTAWFVPAILLLALCTFAFMSARGFSMNEAVLRALTVLVITCPCALGVATPLAKIASIGLGKACGIIVRDHQALEEAKDLDVLVFDKTGTLTAGSFSLTAMISPHVPAEEALRRVASIEARSDHFLAREVLRRAEGLPLEEVSQVASLEGMGVKGRLKSGEASAGNRLFMGSLGFKIPSDLDREALRFEDTGSTVVFFAWEGAVRGVMCFGDTIKESARGVIAELESRGISVQLVSGDSDMTTRSVARQLGIEHCMGGVPPRGKMEIVKNLQSQGRRVGFVGDGINDCPALAQADVGFALGTAAEVFPKTGHISMLSDDPQTFLKALDLSIRTSSTIRQNLFFAVLYNVLAIPLAVSGLLSPLIAVTAMVASSLTVIGNTLRFARRFDSKKEETK